MKLIHFAEAALRLLYPADCALCLQTLELEERHLCSSCQRGMAGRKQAPLTPLDLKIPFIRKAWTFYSYESPVKELLTGIKFERKTWLTHAFDPDMACLKEYLPAEINAVTPIPLDRMKFIQREFNQAGLFAEKIANALEIPALDILAKKFATASQHGLDKRERSVNLMDAFKVRNPRAITGKNILLVDDILTTGATAREAARTLKNNGAAQIFLLAIAHTEINGELP